MKRCYKTYIKGLAIVYVLILQLHLSAQTTEKDYAFKPITTEDGLSNNVVFDIHQDKEGYIWIATNNGLNRYDGYSITSYFHSPKDSTSISSNVIRSIIEDKQGQLWIGTKNGLNRFNRKTQSFEKPVHHNGFSLSNKEVMSMHLDYSGKIWMKASSDIVVFNPETLDAASVYNSKNMLSVTLENLTIWLSSSNGDLISYDVTTQALTTRARALVNSAVHFGDYSKSLWIPTGFQPDIHSNAFKYLPQLPDNINPRHLLEIDTQKSWIGTNNGLFEYDSDKKSLSKIYLGKSTLINQVRSLYKDNTGGLWVGTLGGVFHYDPYRKVFKHNVVVEELDDIIMGLHAPEEGIYANALGKGIYFKSNDSSKFKEIILPQEFPKQGRFIWDMESVSESRFSLWLATNNGLICLDPKTLSYKKVPIPPEENQEHVSFSLLDTHMDFLWIATHGAIHKISKKDEELLASFPLGEDVNYPGIQDIITLGKYIFIATENQGLFKFDISSQNISKLYLKSNKQKLATPVWDLYTSGNILWIGTNDGLYKLSPNDMAIEPVLEDNHVIFSIIQ
ncbi:MAG: two-component regulator propeller domain-containing protein, partial [Bacteroidota bacterium]